MVVKQGGKVGEGCILLGDVQSCSACSGLTP